MAADTNRSDNALVQNMMGVPYSDLCERSLILNGRVLFAGEPLIIETVITKRDNSKNENRSIKAFVRFYHARRNASW